MIVIRKNPFAGPNDHALTESGKYFECRFAVGQEDWFRSGEWLVWVNDGKNDIYIAPERYDSPLKASLHEDGRHYGGLSRPAAKRLKRRKRKLEEWRVDRTRNASPITELFRVYVPYSDLRHSTFPASNNVRWIPAPPQDLQITVSLFQLNGDTAHLATAMSWDGHQILSLTELPSGLGFAIMWRVTQPDLKFIGEIKKSPRLFAQLTPERLRMIVGGGSYAGVRCFWDMAADQFPIVLRRQTR